MKKTKTGQNLFNCLANWVMFSLTYLIRWL